MSTLKVETIQTTGGAAPTLNDLSISHSGTPLQTIIVKDTAGLSLSGDQTVRHLNAAITSKVANSSFLVRYSTAIFTAGTHDSSNTENVDTDIGLGMGYKTGSASTTSTDYTAITTYAPTRQPVAFASSQNRAFYCSDAFGGSSNYSFRYHPLTEIHNEDLFSPSQVAGTVINVAVFASQDGGNSTNYTIGKSPSGFADSGYLSYITVTEIAP